MILFQKDRITAKHIIFLMFFVFSLIFTNHILFNSHIVHAQSTQETACASGEYPKNKDFLGLKPWYAYLTPKPDCTPNINLSGDSPDRFNVLWLIVLALFEDLLRIAGLVAVGFVIWGGIRYVTSQGEPENTRAAYGTIFNAIIGLGIAIIAASAVSFVAARLGGTNPTPGQPLPQISDTAQLVKDVLGILFGIVGGLSVVFVTYGGFTYVKSRGEPAETAKAKDTILYALIGMTVAILATALVNFVVTKL